MREVEINGKRKLCYLLSEGDAAYIVIPWEGLQRIDTKRLNDMEQQGGEMMKVMRDTVLDNGQNALALYQDLIKVVQKPKKAPAPAPKADEGESETTAEAKPKRRRGRPPGKKNAVK